MSTTPAESPLRGVLSLPDWGVIRARGADARSFLHGQLTQDVTHLVSGTARPAGYCTAKGRLLASFVMWAADADTVLLACSADVLPATLKRLRMFVLRAKCTLDDASAEWPAWGLAGAQAGDGVPWSVQTEGGGVRVALPPALVRGQAVPRGLRFGGEAPAGPALALSTWLGLEAASGVPRIVAATVEQFVPQMVNLELVGGVNFQKGCYPGQEVVARSQYRGTLKRRGHLLVGSAPLQPGQEIVHSADPGQPAGLVALAGELPGVGPVALAELKLAALEGGSLHLGAADGPLLTPAALPYAIPASVD
ncbi:MAG: YgfZ/GcvT domain-containing protein [Betaproteobacteria bacterium]